VCVCCVSVSNLGFQGALKPWNPSSRRQTIEIDYPI
jgi:hypothetical protein